MASKCNISVMIVSRKIHVSLRAKNGGMPSQYAFAKLIVSLDPLA